MSHNFVVVVFVSNVNWNMVDLDSEDVSPSLRLNVKKSLNLSSAGNI